MLTGKLRYPVVLVGAAMLAATPKFLPGQDSRAAIEAQYDRLAIAIRRNDVDSILAVQDPSFSSVNPTGNTFDYAAMEAYTRRLVAAIDSIIHIRNLIRQFEQQGDTATADVCQEFSRIQRFGDGRPRRVDTSALQRETWVRRGAAWKRLHVNNVRGMRWFVDGIRVDPSRPYTPGMPAYVPALDPPTGCGLR
jgi:hypothetical protein